MRPTVTADESEVAVRRALCSVTCVLVLTGCAQRQVAPSPTPVPELAGRPEITEDEPLPMISAAPPAPTPSSSVGASSSDGGVVTAVPDASPGASDTASDPPAPPAGERLLLSRSDRRGDHGIEGPDWVDLVAVEVVEAGPDLRVTLQFAGALPSTPAEGEVPLIGVDIGDGDGAYQLFVEGGGQSWAAYLQTPDGFVEYPGSFRLGGRTIVLQVPFNEVGSPTRAPVRVFVEWSRERLAVNATSDDRLDGEPHTFDRSR